jgi:hypothetical protein
MARKKKQTTDPPPENLDNTDDTFGLPEVDYQPLKREEPEKPEESLAQDEPVEHPVERDAPEVVAVNDAPEVTSEPEPTPAQERAFEFKESLHEDSPKDETFETQDRYEDVHQPYTPTYSYKEESSVWPKVIGALLVLALIGIGIWYFAIYKPRQLAKEEQERKELAAIQEDARKKEAERQAARQREDEQKAAAALPPPAPAIGTIETLSGRSGRYYVVIASSIDGDLIMDYAKKLSGSGVSTKIIPPFGKSSFHRLTIAEGDTYETTQARADELKGGDYGDKLWVIKY